jgi:hypothetical protein
MYAVEMIVVMPNGEPTNGKSDKHKKRWKDWRSTMKTPEELAEEYANSITRESARFIRQDVSFAFFSGYQAAQEHAHAALEEAEAEIDRLQTKLSDTGILATDHIVDVSKMVDVSSSETLNNWISVKDRLPEIPENDYSNRVLLLRTDGFIVIARIEKCVRFVRPLQQALIVETDNGDPIEEFTHWMPLPEPPKEEK